MDGQPARPPIIPHRRVLVVSYLLTVLAVAAAAAGCESTSRATPGAAAALDVGVRLDAQIRLADGGQVRVTYRVSNDSQREVVVADGVPARPSSTAPVADERAAYVTVNDEGALVISRRTFEDNDARNSVVSSAKPAQLMLGRVLPAGASAQGSVELAPPVKTYRPYTAASEVKLPTLAQFCVGIVRPADLNRGLQGRADKTRPILEHPTRQAVLCSALQTLRQ